jgi:hypothetical protein
MEFVVTKRLEERDQDRARKRALGISEDDSQSQEDEHPTVVVCSGDLVEQVTLPHFISFFQWSKLFKTGSAPI